MRCVVLALTDFDEVCRPPPRLRFVVTSRCVPMPRRCRSCDDVIHLSPATRFDLQNPSAAGAKPLTLAEVAPGALVEAEGKWIDHHQFAAEKITCDAEQFER